MNNKGQSLVLFVCLIPVIFALFAFVFDYSYMISKNTELEGIAKTSLRHVMNGDKPINKITEIIKKNDKNIEVEITYNSVHLTNELKPIFGKIIGLDKYNLDVKLVGTFKDNKLIIEKG